MGFYSPSQLVQDARRHNVEIRPVDILCSDWESTLETPSMEDNRPAPRQPAIRLGLQRIKGLRTEAAFRIVHARSQQDITDLEDITRRARLDRGDLSRLTEGGAFKRLTGHRYQAHWQARGILPATALDQNQIGTPSMVADTPGVYLAPPAESDDLRADYQSLGLTLGRHPMRMLRERGKPFSQCRSGAELASLKHGRFVQIAGIVTGRQRPSTASGVLFLTLEDDTDNINVVVWTRILEQYRTAITQGRLLKIKGVVERQANIIHVIAGHVEDLSQHLEHFTLQSRDFK
jgi:error-prone DNA polymerase